ncbi:MAG: thioesterase family protein [Candidatus Neomarinimicrobiota bacterium]|jgi:YbgC/YbaW family acyl-CoA thioester hydrolase|nr:thioesterase family protein [Candidatus Neomarinimicrobiota bacterium]MDD3965887.1 thioesterase family protein [Candidatus Neomarinimicrobiota bacterium]MDX9779872.1 thioesterase family protein [bacterium]
MKIWKSSLKVRSYELDSFGHVNNGSFANYLEKARGDYLQQAGMHFDDFCRWKKYPVIARVCIDYEAPAFFGEELEILATVNHLGRSSITLDYEIKKANGCCCAKAQTVMVFVDESGKSVSMPDKMREAFLE